MSAKFHISKDGVPRSCRAKTPEACTATSSELNDHFESKAEATQAYERHMAENDVVTIQQENKKPRNKSSEKQKANSNSKKRQNSSTRSQLNEKSQKLKEDLNKAVYNFDVDVRYIKRGPLDEEGIKLFHKSLESNSSKIEQMIATAKEDGTISAKAGDDFVKDIKKKEAASSALLIAGYINLKQKERLFMSKKKRDNVRAKNAEIDSTIKKLLKKI